MRTLFVDVMTEMHYKDNFLCHFSSCVKPLPLLYLCFMKTVLSEAYKNSGVEIDQIIQNFDAGGLLEKEERNKIKIFNLNNQKINIKSFQIPNAINKIAYRFFRKSKAERSFEYAQKLISKKIGTPQPIAYAEEISGFGFTKSFYVCEHLDCDLTFRKLTKEPDFPNHEAILRAFTQFTFKLHEADVEFLDHSPGNTLIKLNDGDYKFYLVDLNRMNFKKLTFKERMKNFSRLTSKQEIVEVMANEYAMLIEKNETEVFEKMWAYTQDFQRKFHRKKEIKKKLKFWKR